MTMQITGLIPRLLRGGRAGHDPDPRGNERLTAMTGVVLLVLFTAECLTTLSLGHLMTLHFFLGMLLLGPVFLKVGSTLWRFIRYYTGSGPYQRRGPPARLQRVLGPVLILTSMAVLGSGVMLAVVGPASMWELVHRDSFYLWLIVVIIHVIVYAPKLPGLLASRPADRVSHLLAASRARWLLLGGSLAGGLIVALLSYHLSARWGFWGSSLL